MKKWICLLLVAVLAFALAVPASAATYSISSPKWGVTIDGKISKGEWGKAIYSGVSMNKAFKGQVDDQVTAWWFDTTNNKKTYFDLYATHNDKNLYFACVIHNVDREISTDAAVWQQMGFTFTVGKYVEGTDVPVKPYKGDMYEHYTGYRIYQKADGSLGMKTMTLGMTAYDLYANVDYTAVYNPTERTMTYEVAVPFAFTEIKPQEDEYFTFSAVIALDQYSNSVSGTVDGSNRFLIGTAAALCGGPENFAHQGHCIKIKLLDPQKVADSKPKTETTSTKVTYVPQDIETDIYYDGEHQGFAVKTTRLIAIIASAAVILACVVAVVLVLVLDKKKKTTTKHAAGEVIE